MTDEQWHFSFREPGMTLYHRAGMAGLALSLDMLQTQGELPPEVEVDIGEQDLTIRGLSYDKYGLLRLIGLTYPISPEGLIAFPTVRGWSNVAKARLQSLLLKTWLQHPKSRTAAKSQETRTETYDDRTVEWSYLPLKSLKAIESSAENWDKARKRGQPVEIASTILPGAMVRHNALKETALTDSTSRYPLLLFAMLGCLHFDGTALARTGEFDGKTESFVVIPRPAGLSAYVDKLRSYYRYYAQSGISKTWRATGTSDAALSAAVILNVDQHRLYKRLEADLTVIRFGKVVWSQQKTRTGVYHTSKVERSAVKRYKLLDECLEIDGTEGVFPFRDKFATNLIYGRPWYVGFAEYGGTKGWYRITRWKEGLKAMTRNQEMWDEEEQRQFVLLVQNAIRNRFGKVKSDAVARSGDIASMLSREYERMRIAWSKARTRQEFLFGLMDFLAETRPKPDGLSQQPLKILLKLRNKVDWREIRDLCLLALATYSRPEEEKETNPINKNE
ncbi:type I-MYXAN CRISPR-associated Cas8a1/Cmx1 [Paenibacillus cisolokensis]|uniref:type I-MYXAN CRISPR-associated Cas8a1/Cmx1 n=2 Tax=Paenibacillus TaxID=44249 RepID=UPI003D28602F